MIDTYSHDVLLVGGGALVCAPPLPFPSLVRSSVSPSFPRCTRCGATRYRPRGSRSRYQPRGHAWRITLRHDFRRRLAFDQDAVEAFVRKLPKKCCGWNIGAVPGAGNPMAALPFGRLGNEKRTDLVCGRQDRISHAAHPVSDFPSIQCDRAV